MAATEPVKKWEPFVNGEEGCVRETRKGVLHDDDHHFSELFEALKNASAWRKDFFAMLRGRPTWRPLSSNFAYNFVMFNCDGICISQKLLTNINVFYIIYPQSRKEALT